MLFTREFVSCADKQQIDDNREDLRRIKKYKISNYFKLHELSSFAICCTLVFLSAALVQTSKAAAVYSNVDFMTKPNFEPLCSSQQERFVESDGKESSLILEFNSAQWSKSCTRILSAPPSYGFIVRLILPKIRRGGSRFHSTAVSQPSTSSSTTSSSSLSSSASSTASNALGNNLKAKTSATSALSEMTTLIERLNATALKSTSSGRTCPLTIFSSLDPHTPQWRVDPCQLEDTAPEMEDPVRLFHGRIRIVWDHSGQTLHSKLMVTALGKGEQCQSESKHQCLKIGDEPILCISKQLICDGIRHCPYSNEYDSDEDYTMCWKRRRFGEPIPPGMDSDIFEHFALEVFRNLFAFDAPTMPESAATKAPTTVMSAQPAVTTLRKVENNNDRENSTAGVNASNSTNTMNKKSENGTESEGRLTHGRRSSSRSGLSSDFSKYGPWGYLMLGMLLCGGALLICGLWASASQHAANNEREAALQNGAAGFNSSLDHQSNVTSPPNYEELDPPPAYSVLFPNQKAGSSATLSSLAAAAMAVPVTTVLPATISNSSTNSTSTTSTATTTIVTTPSPPPITTTTSYPVLPTVLTRTASISDAASSSQTPRS